MTLAVLSASQERFRADPTAARANPSVTATLNNGHARLTAGAFNWDADLAVAVGGQNLAPSPTAYLLGALAGCGVVFLHDTLAPEFGVRIDAVSAVASCTSDARGLLGMDDVSPALTGIAIDIEVTSPDPEAKTGPMLAAWRERCPIFLALVRPNDVSLTTRVSPTS
jgi:uncharacterized OsmC-like protein